MLDPRVTTKEIAKEGRSVMKNLQPRFTSVYADAGVFCPALKANIHSGGTVLVKDVCGNVRVGRVLDIVSHDKVIVNWCPMMDYGHFKWSPLSDESLCANVELYQGGASDEVSTSCISDVAYVFLQEYITDNNVDLSGIQNAYIIRFRLTNDNQTIFQALSFNVQGLTQKPYIGSEQEGTWPRRRPPWRVLCERANVLFLLEASLLNRPSFGCAIWRRK
jgi:hypothetical protein